MMRYSSAGGVLIVLAVLIPGVAAKPATDQVTLTLPRGDAQAGRAAFVALSCSSCHAIAGEKELPTPISANRGPTLGSYQGKQGAARLGLSIIAPSHEISASVRDRDDDLSPMGDFSEAMTVRQFLDLVEYIRSQGD